MCVGQVMYVHLEPFLQAYDMLCREFRVVLVFCSGSAHAAENDALNFPGGQTHA